MKLEYEIQDILTNKSEKLKTLCRICLSSENSGQFISLFEVNNSTSASEKIALCTKVQLENSDGLPGNICEFCSEKLEIAHSFRIKCEYSDSLLKKIYFNVVHAGIVKEIQELPSTSVILKDEVEAIDDWIKFEEDNHSDGSIKDFGHENIASLTESLKLGKNNDSDGTEKCEKIATESKKVVAKMNVKKKSKISLCNGDGTKKFLCHLCNKGLSTKYSLEKHVASMHRDEKKLKSVKMYQCSECSYSTPRSYTLGYHMSIHTGEKPFQCDICERRFAQPSSLYVHKKSHSDKMYYTCAECGKQFKHKFIYENHKNVHNNIKKFTCAICNKGLRSQQTLEDHMNRHYNIKNFSCEICGSTFVTRVELISHGKKHSDEKRFQCSICEYRCNVKKSLETHVLRHTGKRLFKCELCELSCYTRVELKLHMRKHTKEKNYSCPVCQIKFSRSTGVNKHMMYTHGIQYKINDTTDRRIIK